MADDDSRTTVSFDPLEIAVAFIAVMTLINIYISVKHTDEKLERIAVAVEAIGTGGGTPPPPQDSRSPEAGSLRHEEGI